MIIGSVSENINIEKRVAITPDIIKKYKSLGFEIYLTKDYASHIGIKDEEYETEGANIKSNDEVLSSANAILQMNILNDESLNKLKKDQTLVGVLNPYLNEKKLREITLKNINCFSLELLPELLEHNLWIYYHPKQIWQDTKLLLTLSYFQKAIPMMMIVAGTISYVLKF